MPEINDKKLLLIVNPVSGKKMAKQYMMKMINRFDSAGYNVTACCTQVNKNAYDIVLNRGGGFDLIVCVGGDGTLKETVCGIIKLGSNIPIGYVPMGSTNDFANSMGIPTGNVLEAVEAIINGQPTPVDVGMFGGENFIYIAACGNFTAISYSANQKVKNVIGKNAYYLQAAKEFFNMKPFHARVEADGEFFEGDYFYGAFSNSYSVGGMSVLKNMGVEFNDGLFEMVLVDMFKNPGEIAYLASSMVRKNVSDNRLVTIRHCEHVKFMFDEPMPFTLDGEFGGKYTEINASAIHNAVNIMLRRTDWVETKSLLAPEEQN